LETKTPRKKYFVIFITLSGWLISQYLATNRTFYKQLGSQKHFATWIQRRK